MLPLLLVLLIFAQLDLACGLGWPLPLLKLLHLSPIVDDSCRGVARGLGCSLDVLVAFQLLRSVARRALETGCDK
jgi:hypothetical protein